MCGPQSGEGGIVYEPNLMGAGNTPAERVNRTQEPLSLVWEDERRIESMYPSLRVEAGSKTWGSSSEERGTDPGIQPKKED